MGGDCIGRARLVWAWQAWRGRACTGRVLRVQVWFDMAGMASMVQAWLGWERQGRRG